MKTYTVTLTKPGHTATASIQYVDASWPTVIGWSGDRQAFRLSDGDPVALLCTMDRVAETAAHQAKQADATFEITDDGGDAPM